MGGHTHNSTTRLTGPLVFLDNMSLCITKRPSDVRGAGITVQALGLVSKSQQPWLLLSHRPRCENPWRYWSLQLKGTKLHLE